VAALGAVKAAAEPKRAHRSTLRAKFIVCSFCIYVIYVIY
jgi:hypothetical protein